MDINEYLHLYVGCDVIHKDRTTAKLVSTTTMGECVFIHNDTNQFGTSTPEDFGKLILRTLPDMTDDEALTVAMIALGRDSTNGLRLNRAPNRDYVSIWYAQWLPVSNHEKENWTECDLEVCISDSFTIYNHTFYRKGNATAVGNEPLYNQHKITKFLLSKGFDLFGLIDAGLAINVTTLKTEKV